MQPLEGTTVIDATQALVGPPARQTLGEPGAEVVKIEYPTNGDLTRAFTPRYNGLSTCFVGLNRNKRSLTLDRDEFDSVTDCTSSRAGPDANLDNTFPERSTEEWTERLDAESVPSSPLNTVEDIVNDPQKEQNGMLAEMDHPELGYSDEEIARFESDGVV